MGAVAFDPDGSMRFAGKRLRRIGLGCMGMSQAYGSSDRDESLATLTLALDQGACMFDTSDFYGDGHNETLLGEALHGRYDEAVIATKCGIIRGDAPLQQHRDSSPRHIREACDASLKRLGCETIDLYYLHRIDGVTPIEDSMLALADLRQAGKIRAAGLSEVSEATLRRAHEVFPVSAVQNEYSIATRGGEGERVLKACAELDALFVPYAPISRGLLSGAYRDAQTFQKGDFRTVLPRFAEGALETNLSLVDRLRDLADDRGATLAQLALAWLLAQDRHVVPIPGTRRRDRLLENLNAEQIDLDDRDLRLIESLVPPDSVEGNRQPEAIRRSLD